mmetsp:Transcript_30338/g.59409  ORF Transcript_30338/g.59409 Transcript_30338/m.59409 type:complete len:221 (+) Transcript_30338:536-1198(+)
MPCRRTVAAWNSYLGVPPPLKIIFRAFFEILGAQNTLYFGVFSIDAPFRRCTPVLRFHKKFLVRFWEHVAQSRFGSFYIGCSSFETFFWAIIRVFRVEHLGQVKPITEHHGWGWSRFFLLRRFFFVFLCFFVGFLLVSFDRSVSIGVVASILEHLLEVNRIGVVELELHDSVPVVHVLHSLALFLAIHLPGSLAVVFHRQVLLPGPHGSSRGRGRGRQQQ